MSLKCTLLFACTLLFGTILGFDINVNSIRLDNDGNSKLSSEVEASNFARLEEQKKQEFELEQLLQTFQKKKRNLFQESKNEEDVENKYNDKTSDHFTQLKDLFNEIDKRFKQEESSNLNNVQMGTVDDASYAVNDGAVNFFENLDLEQEKTKNSIETNKVRKELTENEIKKRFNLYMEQRNSLKKLEKLLNDLTSISKNTEKRSRQECILWQGDQCVRMCRPSVWCG